MEGERQREAELRRGEMPETLGSESVSTKRARMADVAGRRRGEALTILSQHIDVEWLREGTV